ncbi:hypothetical protein [Halobacterium jilantaiense]|uniref:Peptide ABC transporter ATP-binding protein n=1 Tax=Halobacterium jilantaiense TaxID=355548 RepID=A0A1I0MLD6_9EURY|nr:hypothetical protein [Halobacterium jilantaiense]SEV89168.1 hypothetical protein SAMN04487945_0172 [Halobacterium jilantaiense]
MKRSSDRSTPAPLAVETDLDVTVAGRPVDVESTGDRVFVEFPTLETARIAARSGGVDRIRAAAATLDAAGLTAELRVRDRTVLVVGAGARSGVLSRRLDLAPAEFRLGGALGALGRELAALAAAVRDPW